MATSARIGHGTLFSVGDAASPEVFTVIAEVTSITPPSITRDIVDASHMEMGDRWRQFVVGRLDGGEAKIEMNFIPGGPGQALLAELQALDDPANIRIEWTNGQVWAFTAYCVGFEPTAPVDDKMTATATFKVTGPIDFNAGTPLGFDFLTLGGDLLTLGGDPLYLG